MVCNIQPHNSKLKPFIRDLNPVIDMGPNALIMSDPGLIQMVREEFSHMPIHLSVQADAVNWATVQFWASQGVERVIGSRELSLEEIEEIRENARIPKLNPSCMALYVWFIPVVACCLVTSTSAIQTKVLALTHAVGNTKLKQQRR